MWLGIRVRKGKWFQVTNFPVCPPAVHAQRELGNLPCRAFSLLLPAAVFSGCASTLQRLPACQTNRGRSARDNLSLARIEYRSPDLPGGVLAPGLPLRFIVPDLHLEPFGYRLPTSAVSGIGVGPCRKPVLDTRPDTFHLFASRRSPSGLSSLRILALRRSLPLPVNECARL